MVIVGAGGVIGAICRYLIYTWLAKPSTGFPYATWIANMSGAFLLGFIFTMYEGGVLSDNMWLFLGVGILGSYTTLSTFGFEVADFVLARKYRLAFLYIVSSLVIGLCLVWAGWHLGLSSQH